MTKSLEESRIEVAQIDFEDMQKQRLRAGNQIACFNSPGHNTGIGRHMVVHVHFKPDLILQQTLVETLIARILAFSTPHIRDNIATRSGAELCQLNVTILDTLSNLAVIDLAAEGRVLLMSAHWHVRCLGPSVIFANARLKARLPLFVSLTQLFEDWVVTS